ncbi:L-2-hydroxyglutarate oxidase [Rhodococcus sp. NPDC060176]|uniref:L-2-hydroxyglutarate oxidase n=1 Tax=Rhodococcus sp. NPDC060176 TaxID=3347062 RepID=UPI003652ED98
MNAPKRCAVIGAGIIGTAVARELLQRFDGAQVTLFDKEDHVAAHQTGHNSGVVHAGLYYEPGSLKARLCRRGVSLLQEFSAEHDVPYEECGKVVVATTTQEESRLEDIYARAVANGVPGVKMLDCDGLAETEPNAAGRAALHSPHTAIIDYTAATEALARDFRSNGGVVRLSTSVVRLQNKGGKVLVYTTHDVEEFDLVIACAGLQSDRLARRSGEEDDPAIVPFFGQYFILDAQFDDAVKGLVYPVPDPQYPFLGVHVTRRIDGGLMIGPNAFLSFSREKYRGLGFDTPDALSIARMPGFWKFASQNLATARREIGGVLSTKKFVEEAAKLVPNLTGAHGKRADRGIRAQAMRRNGELVDDFVIQRRGAALFVRNAPSPGATSSLAIAEYLVDEASQ